MKISEPRGLCDSCKHLTFDIESESPDKAWCSKKDREPNLKEINDDCDDWERDYNR